MGHSRQQRIKSAQRRQERLLKKEAKIEKKLERRNLKKVVKEKIHEYGDSNI